MRKVVLISCVSRKRTRRCKARELYVSTLFKKNLQYAMKLAPHQIFILSAKHGLVELDDEIEPYDLTLNDLPTVEIKRWANSVLQQLAERTDLKQDQFIFLAGTKYRRYLIPHLAHVDVPLEGLRIGEQLRQLGRT